MTDILNDLEAFTEAMRDAARAWSTGREADFTKVVEEVFNTHRQVREAVEFYADPIHWSSETGGGYDWASMCGHWREQGVWVIDTGDRAREALAAADSDGSTT